MTAQSQAFAISSSCRAENRHIRHGFRGDSSPNRFRLVSPDIRYTRLTWGPPPESAVSPGFPGFMALHIQAPAITISPTPGSPLA